MSLINDALKRARLEALRQEASQGGDDYRAVPAHSRRASRSLLAVAGWAVAAVSIVLAAWLGLRSAGREPEVTTPSMKTPGEAPGVATSRSEGGTPVPSDAAAQSGASEASAGRAQPSSPSESGDRAASSALSGAGIEPAETAPAPPEAPVGAPAAPAEPAAGASPPAASGRAETQTPGRRLASGATYLREVTAADGASLSLGGIAYSMDRPIAVINGSVVAPGDLIAGFTVIAIEPERVELEVDGARFYLTLH